MYSHERPFLESEVKRLRLLPVLSQSHGVIGMGHRGSSNLGDIGENPASLPCLDHCISQALNSSLTRPPAPDNADLSGNWTATPALSKVSSRISILNYLGFLSRSRIAGTYVIVCLTFCRTARLFSKMAIPFYIPTSIKWILQFLYILRNTCYCPHF